MCQIIVKRFTDNEEMLSFMIKNKKNLIDILNIKGGEGYSYSLIDEKGNTVIIKSKKDKYDKFLKKLMEYVLKPRTYYLHKYIVLFSRQRPEMENDFNKNLLPPFKDDKDILIHNTEIHRTTYYWVHGTIGNDQELAEKYDIDINVDTEIVEKVPRHELNGLYSEFKITFEFDKYHEKDIYDSNIIDIDIDFIDKGLGWWGNTLKNFYTVQPLDDLFEKRLLFKTKQLNNFIKDVPRNINIWVSYSGGMDATLSAYKAIKQEFSKYTLNSVLNKSEFYKNHKININLCYFKYGSQAEEEELKRVHEFKKYIEKSFKNDFGYANFNIEIKEFEVTEIMHSFINFYGYSKLIDKEAKGDISETENNHQYVPFRNSIFAQLISTEIDKEIDNDPEIKNDHNVIVFGLNLTEGQVFGDNGIAWLQSIEEVAKRGGKYFKEIKVNAPYVHKTKINMLKEFGMEFGKKKLNELLDISFSCYYPKEDGSPCGECGSCILREAAINSIKTIKFTKKDKHEKPKFLSTE